jgi:4-hydroxybenzoyl-CoA thioesterase
VLPGRFERTQRIRFAHCDPAGIVFFPQYLVLLNGHVEDWVGEALGVPYAELIGRRRIGLPTVRLECDFRAVSRMGEDVVFALAVERIGTRSLVLHTEVGHQGELRAALRQVLVTTDLDTHQAIMLPEDLRAAALRFTQDTRSPRS